MRVISGKARGKKLISIDSINTRPTLDRVKESLFNIIQFDIMDAVVLDLFAGSGALGIEALSRGAKKAYFCDKSYETIKYIKKNIEATRLEENSTIINKEFTESLKELAKKGEKFDIVFLDPPYKTDFGIKAIEEIFRFNLLSKDGIIILETDDENKKEEILRKNDIEVFDVRKYGKVLLIFIRKG